MKQILCIGEALIDMICTDKGRLLVDGENFVKKPGGAPTNVAAAIGALGGSVGILAKIGNDSFGQHLNKVMLEFGVSNKWLLIDEKKFTTFAFVSLLEDGERDFVFNRGADGELDESDIEAVDLAGVGIVHFGSATAFLPGPLQAAYYRLLRKALDKGIAVSFDPNYRQVLFAHNKPDFIAHAWNFLGTADFFKLSDEEALLLAETENIDEAIERLSTRTKAAFAITIGKEGTLLRCGETVERIPSIPVKVVDTTGAGDAFVGAVLYQLAAGDKFVPAEGLAPNIAEWRTIISNANKAGARTCQYLGAMEAFKHLSTEIFD